MSYARQKGKKFEKKIANIINEVFNINNANIPELLKANRCFSSGSANYESGDINFGILYTYFPNIVIECKKWNNITKKVSTIKYLYRQYSQKHNDKTVWLIIEDRYGKPIIILPRNLTYVQGLSKQLNIVLDLKDNELIALDFKTFIQAYKDYFTKQQNTQQNQNS